jgi:hypothetical protein
VTFSCRRSGSGRQADPPPAQRVREEQLGNAPGHGLVALERLGRREQRGRRSRIVGERQLRSQPADEQLETLVMPAGAEPSRLSGRRRPTRARMPRSRARLGSPSAARRPGRSRRCSRGPQREGRTQEERRNRLGLPQRLLACELVPRVAVAAREWKPSPEPHWHRSNAVERIAARLGVARHRRQTHFGRVRPWRLDSAGRVDCSRLRASCPASDTPAGRRGRATSAAPCSRARPSP